MWQDVDGLPGLAEILVHNLQRSTQRLIFSKQFGRDGHRTWFPHLHQRLKLLALRSSSSFPDQQYGQGELALGQICSQRFASRRFGPKKVHAIVEHLVSRTESKAKLAQRSPMLR